MITVRSTEEYIKHQHADLLNAHRTDYEHGIEYAKGTGWYTGIKHLIEVINNPVTKDEYKTSIEPTMRAWRIGVLIGRKRIPPNERTGSL